MASQAFYTPRQRELRYETCQAPIVRGRGYAQYDFFQAPNPSGLLVVLWHGWLGHNTLRFVANEVRGDGHNVVVIGNPQREAHSMIKHAVERTRESDVVIWDHSDGHRHVSKMLEHQKGRSDEELTYRVRAVQAHAPVGTNGKGINLLNLPGEIAGHVQLLREHPRAELDMLFESTKNCLQNPLRAALDGLAAATYRSRLTAGIHDGVGVEITYFEDDHVIEPPDDRSNVLVLPGSHTTPVVDTDIARDAVSRAYAQL